MQFRSQMIGSCSLSPLTRERASVMPSGRCQGIIIVENDLSRNGIEYEVAISESIANLGERRCQVMTVGSMAPKRIVFQIADIHKPLLSISRHAPTWATIAISARRARCCATASPVRLYFSNAEATDIPSRCGSDRMPEEIVARVIMGRHSKGDKLS